MHHEFIFTVPIYFTRDMYKRLDDKYIKPCLLRENHFKDPKIIETYENLTERDALEFMKRNPTQFAELAGSKTMVDLNELAIKEQDSNANSPVQESSFNHANRDPKEVHYNHSQRDMDETKIKHMLSENLFQARNQPRKLSYSRHVIGDEGDAEPVANNTGVNYKVHMQVVSIMVIPAQSEKKISLKHSCMKIRMLLKKGFCLIVSHSTS